MSGTPPLSITAVLQAMKLHIAAQSEDDAMTWWEGLDSLLDAAAVKDTQMKSLLQPCLKNAPSIVMNPKKLSLQELVMANIKPLLSCLGPRNFTYALDASTTPLSASLLLEPLFLLVLDDVSGLTSCLNTAANTSSAIVPCLQPYIEAFNDRAGNVADGLLSPHQEHIAEYVGIGIAAVVVIAIIAMIVHGVIKGRREEEAAADSP